MRGRSTAARRWANPNLNPNPGPDPNPIPNPNPNPNPNRNPHSNQVGAALRAAGGRNAAPALGDLDGDGVADLLVETRLWAPYP